jgi:3-oxoadipate enol-lactonase
MPAISLEFGTLYYRARGSGPETVVLLHDYFGTHRGWSALQLQLSRYALVLAPDLRGHGQSVLQRGDLGISSMSQDMIALLDQLEIDRAHFVGCSHGAVIAMHLARRNADRVASIVITSVPDLNDLETIEYGRQYVTNVFPRLEADLARIHGDGESDYVRETLLRNFEESLEHPPQDHLDVFLKAHEIQCPALVLGGDSDPVMGPERAIQLMRKIPSAQLSILQNAGHLAHEDAPGLYADSVLDHLLRNRP